MHIFILIVCVCLVSFIQQQHQPTSEQLSAEVAPNTKKPAKKPKKPKAKKDSTNQQPVPIIQTSQSATTTSQTQSHAKIVQSR